MSLFATNQHPLPAAGPLPEFVDHIVIGADAAGCVLAARLSERSDRTVLLVEVGGVIDPVAVRVPARYLELWNAPSLWEDLTPPQAGLGGRRITMHTGRGLSGGSSVNAMGWFSGMPQDYDGWAAGGAAGWGDRRPALPAAQRGPRTGGE